MKINPPINSIADALEQRAILVGWKPVGLSVADAYHAQGGGDLLPETSTETGMHNAVQRVKRIFRGYDGPRYAPLADKLRNAALAALPFDVRAELEQPASPALLASKAAKEGIEAVNAVNLGAATEEVLKEIDEAISAFMNLKKRCMAAVNSEH